MHFFYLTSLQKQSRPGKNQKPIELAAFDQEPNLCVIRHLKAYVAKTSVYRGDTNRNQLLLSFQKPFKPVSKDTISRWIKLGCQSGMSDWDVSQVLTHVRSYPPVEDISLTKLTFKVTLLALLTGQQTQTIHC